jgi:hypothetical protein
LYSQSLSLKLVIKKKKSVETILRRKLVGARQLSLNEDGTGSASQWNTF